MAIAPQMGLFGGMGTPEEMQRAAAEQKAMQFATMSPQQQLSYNIFKNTSNLGRGLAGAMGVDVQDPAMKRATMLRQLASQYDTNTPEGLRQMAAALQGTDPELGFQISQRADALELSKAKIGSENALIKQREREKASADPAQKLLEGAKYTPESIAEFQRTGNPTDLKFVEKPGGRPQIKEIGVAEGTREPVYTYQTGNDEPTQVVFKNVNGKQQMVPYTGGVDRTTAKTNVGVKLPEGESEFVKRLAGKDADRVDAAITTRENASSAINSLNKLASLPADQLISGQFATGRVGVTNLLQTLGLASPADASKLASSQQYQKVAGDVILQTLGGKLGSGFSNADREFIASLVPQLETDPEARRKLIKFMQDKNQEIVKESIRLENYARANRGLSGFEPKIPMSVAPTTKYSGLSEAELDARIAAEQAKKGNK